MPVIVRAATVADSESLSALAAATFRDAFGDQNTPEDMARYLADAFTPAKQAAEIVDPATVVLVAEDQPTEGAAELIGYAHLSEGETPEAVRGLAPIEIKRLYVARRWHGRRVAQLLMDASIEAARARGASTLWLGVWERNPRAIAFYEKYGFVRVGEHVFVLGGDVQTDWLMTRAI
jgi:ribosomal protein S18 acetylase RimI-like enzyme